MLFVFAPEEGGRGPIVIKLIFVYNIILMSNNGHLAGQTECIIRISKEASTK